jgi:hypothetical protein
MARWVQIKMSDDAYIAKLDKKLIAEGKLLHQRPFHAAIQLVHDRGGGNILAPDI